MVGGFNLTYTVIWGFCAAALLVGVTWLIATIRVRKADRMRLWSAVAAGTPWSAKGSWVTNLAAVSAVLTAAFTKLGTGSSPLVPPTAAAAITILSVGFAGMAALAPVVYAACRRQPGPAQPGDQGTVCGYLLAAFATLFAVSGEIAVFVMFIAKAMPAGPGRGTLVVFLVVMTAFAALAVGVYSAGAIYSVLTVCVADGQLAAGASGQPGTAGPLLYRRIPDQQAGFFPADQRSATL
jgi:hypothetical protein